MHLNFPKWRHLGFGEAENSAIRSAYPENSNGDISATDHPIYSVFGSRMGFSVSTDRMALFPV